MAPYITPWSVRARAGISSSAARATIALMRLAPSSSENSVWLWRWTKVSGACGIGVGGGGPSDSSGAAGNPAEVFGGEVGQLQGGTPHLRWGPLQHRSERIRDTRSEERRRGRRRWSASGVPTKPASWGG